MPSQDSRRTRRPRDPDRSTVPPWSQEKLRHRVDAATCATAPWPPLRRRRGDQAIDRGQALLPAPAHHVTHLIRMPVAANHQAFDRLLIQRPVSMHRSGLQQADQLSETLGIPIVGRSRSKDERIGLPGQNRSQSIIERTLVRHIMGFVDHRRVPVLLAQMSQIPIILQGVDRDDRARIDAERVAGGRNAAPHTLNTLGIQAHEGQCETAPHLMLHLLQHMAGSDDQDPIPATPAHQLCQDHADLQGLAQADGISEQNTGPEIIRAQGLAHCAQLILQGVGQHIPHHRQLPARRGQRRLAERGLQPQAREAMADRGVGDNLRAARIHRLDAVDARTELRSRVAHQLGQALDGHQRPIAGGGDLGHQPILVPYPHHGARGDINRDRGGAR